MLQGRPVVCVMADLLEGDVLDSGEYEDVVLLKRTWRNEKCAPVLLPYAEVSTFCGAMPTT